MNHVEMEQDRKKSLDTILQSSDKYKLIIAGASTGKSYTFKCLLESMQGDRLALTFINNLASDIAKDLSSLAEVRTFHSFCRKLLHKISSKGIGFDFHFFTKLSQLIAKDALFLQACRYLVKIFGLLSKNPLANESNHLQRYIDKFQAQFCMYPFVCVHREWVDCSV